MISLIYYTLLDIIGNGISFDGLPGDGLSFIPYSLKIFILRLLQKIFGNMYPSHWRKQLLFPVVKKGHTTTKPKLSGIAVVPLFSRIYDIIVSKTFCAWHCPNPEQAEFREGQGCIIQIFALFTSISMANCLNESIYIGLLDFVKAFDFMNSPQLLKELKDSNGMDEQISVDHGATQGRHSSCNIFSF